MTMTIWIVLGDRDAGDWISEPTAISQAVVVMASGIKVPEDGDSTLLADALRPYVIAFLQRYYPEQMADALVRVRDPLGPELCRFRFRAGEIVAEDDAPAGDGDPPPPAA